MSNERHNVASGPLLLRPREVKNRRLNEVVTIIRKTSKDILQYHHRRKMATMTPLTTREPEFLGED